MQELKSISLFCSAGMGEDRIFAETARKFGHLLAERKIQLVYGGSKDGLMGVVADAVLEKGGKAVGVLPRFLAEKREIAHKGLTELIYVETLSERKILLSKLSEASIVLPGGFGTMDELFEMLTWSQLNLHQHRCGILNVKGLFSPLEELFIRMANEKLLHQKNRDLYIFEENPDVLLDKLAMMKVAAN